MGWGEEPGRGWDWPGRTSPRGLACKRITLNAGRGCFIGGEQTARSARIEDWRESLLEGGEIRSRRLQTRCEWPGSTDSKNGALSMIFALERLSCVLDF